MSEPFDLAQVYRDVEDRLAPSLRLTMPERVLYYHLLRHSLLEGQPTVRVSKRSLCRGIACSFMTVHTHLRHLEEKGCVRIRERGRAGHLIEVLAPQQILRLRTPPTEAAPDLAESDWFGSDRLRAVILERENYACFYCLRRLPTGAACFDHAVPVAAGGDNSYGNIVACCFDCNSLKRDEPAEAFLRSLYRSSRLTLAELDHRLAALAALSALSSNQIVPTLAPV